MSLVNTVTDPATAFSVPLCSLGERYTYHVVSASASMPNKCWGIYKRVAVIEVDHHERPAGYVPERIADAYGITVCETWERLNVGKTEDCAYARALVDAQNTAQELRTQRGREAAEDRGDVLTLCVAV